MDAGTADPDAPTDGSNDERLEPCLGAEGVAPAFLNRSRRDAIEMENDSADCDRNQQD